ncbi:MAG TPA: hypothetical protein VFQ24_01340 [Terriglobia bacterium]|nr:hypothetical protein [Terriglobia bacterium]
MVLLNDRHGPDGVKLNGNVPLRGIADSTRRESAPPARRCYLSAAGDGTVFEIESWVGTAIDFRIDSRRDATENRCAKSLMVSREFATGAGLELGLLRRQVMAILGPSTVVKGQRLELGQSIDRPLTLRGKLHLEESGPPWGAKPAHIMDRVEVGLSKSEVVSIDVLHNAAD